MAGEQISTGTVPDIDPSLVTTGMPTDGGILYINFGDNPKVPTDATTPLGAGWESMGDLDKDAMTEVFELSSTSHEDYSGAEVLTTIDSDKRTLKVRCIEYERVSVNKALYGPENVTADGSVISAIKDKGINQREYPLVCEEMESNGYKRRTSIGRAKLKSVGDVSHQKGSLMIHELTFSVTKDADGDFKKIYRAKPSD